ncbi:hypothetical protein H5410_027745 [Solanum commersonii]|uniref:Uncharacterized protein n=1 Tax=Solanum commersonii TaxID=4109 RepID=A0A9J5Z237_SOLCO|nr:hypothetical protein H5410_027745 [Solanum commersonii]
MPLHKKKNLSLCKTQQLQAQKEWNSSRANLAKTIPPQNSLQMPDKTENRLLSKHDNLQIEVQAPSWPRNRVRRNAHRPPTFKIVQVYSSQTSRHIHIQQTRSS